VLEVPLYVALFIFICIGGSLAFMLASESFSKSKGVYRIEISNDFKRLFITRKSCGIQSKFLWNEKNLVVFN
jgi:hypothetical protein